MARQLSSTGRRVSGAGHTSSSTSPAEKSAPSATRAPIALMMDAAFSTGSPHSTSSGTWQVSHMPTLYAHGGAASSPCRPEMAQPCSPTVAATQLMYAVVLWILARAVRLRRVAGALRTAAATGAALGEVHGFTLRRGSDIPGGRDNPLLARLAHPPASCARADHRAEATRQRDDRRHGQRGEQGPAAVAEHERDDRPRPAPPPAGPGRAAPGRPRSCSRGRPRGTGSSAARRAPPGWPGRARTARSARGRTPPPPRGTGARAGARRHPPAGRGPAPGQLAGHLGGAADVGVDRAERQQDGRDGGGRRPRRSPRRPAAGRRAARWSPRPAPRTPIVATASPR